MSGVCDKNIVTASICFSEVIKIGNRMNVTKPKIINSLKYPNGCSFVTNLDNIITNVRYNQMSGINCGINADVILGNTHIDPNTNVGVGVIINTTHNQVILNLTGPSSLWYGVAFNAYNMGDLPYSIIVDGSGVVSEYKLGNHECGEKLTSSLKVLTNNINGDFRSVLVSRTLSGLNTKYYTFTNNQATIPMLTAVGYNGVYSYHHAKSAMNLYMSAVNTSTCMCNTGVHGTINGIPFEKNCAAEPTSDLLNQKNPTCFIDTYQGGLSCCHHKNILLDTNQVQPTHEMTYQIKFRFWFQDYNNHLPLIRLYFQTEAYSGEYDIPKCPNGIPSNQCIHSITSRWKGYQMVENADMGNSSGVKLIYAGPHCHAPSCISMELYNGDTGELLCHVDGDLGKGQKNIKFDEHGYIKINPCLWGYDEGLLTPPYISWNTSLISIKKNNNTWGHYGEMASWQMRGILAFT